MPTDLRLLQRAAAQLEALRASLPVGAIACGAALTEEIDQLHEAIAEHQRREEQARACFLNPELAAFSMVSDLELS